MMHHLVIIMCLILITVSFFIPMPTDKVVFLDIGQGDAILLQSGTQQLLIDGGPGRTLLTRLGEEMPWFDHTIEVVVVTHPQRDHLEGLIHALAVYDVGLVVMPYESAESGMQETWINKLLARNIPYRFGWNGQRVQFHNMLVNILGPLEGDAAAAARREDINNASVITRIDFCPEGTTPRSFLAGRSTDEDRSEVGPCLSLLLTGDAETRVEKLLVEQLPAAQLDVDILKAGHHGSKTSTSQALLDATTPSAAVISVGKENSYGHPHPTVLARLRGIPVLRTDESGSVRFQYLDGQWALKKFNEK